MKVCWKNVFCLFEYIFIFPSILKNIYTGYWIFGCTYFLLEHWWYQSTGPLVSIAAFKKSGVILAAPPFPEALFFPLATFKVFLLFGVVDCHYGVFGYVFLFYWRFFGLLKPVIHRWLSLSLWRLPPPCSLSSLWVSVRFRPESDLLTLFSMSQLLPRVSISLLLWAIFWRIPVPISFSSLILSPGGLIASQPVHWTFIVKDWIFYF